MIKVELFLECFHIRKVGRGRYSDDEQALEFYLSKHGSLLAFADRDLSSCTGLETAVKMPEETDFTPKSGLLTAVYKPLNVIRFQVSTYFGSCTHLQSVNSKRTGTLTQYNSPYNTMKPS